MPITSSETKTSPDVATITGSITSCLVFNFLLINRIKSILFSIPILITFISRSDITESICETIKSVGKSNIS